MDASREERLREFLRRLDEADCASSFDEARRLIADTLNQVEDEMTTIPQDPANWQTDGRMYPPQDDAIRDVVDHPDVKRFRAKRHNIFIRENGSFEIREVGGPVLVAHPGSDGRGVWDP
jgi:hypothetical protein